MSFKRIILTALIPVAVILTIAFFGIVGGQGTTQVPAAATQPPSHAIDQVMYDADELERAAQKAEEVSTKVYEGMGKIEETQGDVGGRTQHLDDARRSANVKWKLFADKIRAVEETGEPLTPPDRVNIDSLLENDK